ncbi:MAG: hypothetical protein ABSG96_00180 [Terracidiphilus sp.]
MKGLSTFGAMPGIDEGLGSLFFERATDCEFHFAHIVDTLMEEQLGFHPNPLMA